MHFPGRRPYFWQLTEMRTLTGSKPPVGTGDEVASKRLTARSQLHLFVIQQHRVTQQNASNTPSMLHEKNIFFLFSGFCLLVNVPLFHMTSILKSISFILRLWLCPVQKGCEKTKHARLLDFWEFPRHKWDYWWGLIWYWSNWHNVDFSRVRN